MGWKSTIDISRKEAAQLILARLLDATNEELSSALDSLGYGDNPELNYYGHNFIVLDKVPKASPDVCYRCKYEGQSACLDPCHYCDGGSSYENYEKG